MFADIDHSYWSREAFRMGRDCRRAAASIDTPPSVHYRPPTQMSTFFEYRGPA